MELIVNVREDEYLGDFRVKAINIPYSEIPEHWWQVHVQLPNNYLTILNNQQILSEIQLEITQRLDNSSPGR